MNDELLKELINEIKVHNKLLMRLIAQDTLPRFNCKADYQLLEKSFTEVEKWIQTQK